MEDTLLFRTADLLRRLLKAHNAADPTFCEHCEGSEEGELREDHREEVDRLLTEIEDRNHDALLSRIAATEEGPK